MKENKDIWNKIFSSRDWGQYPAEDLVRFISNNFGKSKLKKKKNYFRNWMWTRWKFKLSFKGRFYYSWYRFIKKSN